jgi:hypothetical protein
VDRTDRHERTIETLKMEMIEKLTVPVRSAAVRPDGGELLAPDVIVRGGDDRRLREVLFDDRPTVTSPDVPTITVYPEKTRRGSIVRRVLERLVF